MDGDSIYSPSLKTKLKQSLRCFCLHRPLSSPPPAPGFALNDKLTVIWIKTKGTHPLARSLSDVKVKCHSMLGFGGTKHKRYSSGEFRYDPLSYALNFEDGYAFDDDQAPLRNFTARLPASLPVKPHQIAPVTS